jgi:hypothetical protein
MGTSDHQSGHGTTGSTDMISRRSSFCSLLELNSSSPPKMTLMVFEASWNFALCDLSPWSSFSGSLSAGLFFLLLPGCHGHFFCRSFSNSSCVVVFLPREGQSTTVTRLSGLCFRDGPSSPASSCRYDCRLCASGCCHCTSGTTPTSFPLARTSHASCHEVLQQFFSILPKVSIDAWVGNAIVEAVDNVLLRDVRNGGSHVEKNGVCMTVGAHYVPAYIEQGHDGYLHG